MKFRSSDTIIFHDGKIIIGPILNRRQREWNYYYITIKNTSYIDSTCLYNTTYGEFRKLHTIEYVELCTDQSRPTDKNDMISDLQFMRNEIKKYENIMNKYQDIDMSKYQFYHDLIYINTYKIFQFDTEDEYNNYVNEINCIVKKENERYITNISNVIDDVFRKIDYLN